MHRHFFSLRIAAIVVLAAIVVGTIDLFLNGYAVVADPDRQLMRAALRSGIGDQRPMRAVARGFWAARPARDGRIVMTCANGTVLDGPDVTGGTVTRHMVAPGACARVAPGAGGR